MMIQGQKALLEDLDGQGRDLGAQGADIEGKRLSVG